MECTRKTRDNLSAVSISLISLCVCPVILYCIFYDFKLWSIKIHTLVSMINSLRIQFGYVRRVTVTSS